MDRWDRFWLTLVVILGLAQPATQWTWAQDKQAPAEVVEVKVDPRPVLLTVATAPARWALCGWNSWLAWIYMSFSAGTRYADAAQMLESGCAGSWVVTPEMVEQAGTTPPAKRSVVWDIDNLR